MSRRPSFSLDLRPEPKIGKFRLSDEHRVLFPGLEPTGLHAAWYYITPLGRVYRDDGRLLKPHAKTLKVKLNGGRVYRSVPAAVYAAFGNVKKGALFIPWVPEDAPLDELTGRRTCDIRKIRLVHRGNLIRLAQGSIEPSQLKTYKAFVYRKPKPGVPSVP